MTSNTTRPILVTGSAGFIGSHVVEALLGRGHPVVGVDNLDPFYDPSVKAENIERCRAAAGDVPFEQVLCDIRDADALGTCFERTRPASVIHLAAKAGVRPSIDDPVAYTSTNVLGTSVLLEQSRRVGVERLIIASSSSVYGNNPTVPFAETDPVDHPISPYAATKRACELIAHAHHHLTGVPTACLRFFTVFGPRQRPDLAIHRFMRRIAAGEAIPVFGDASSSRDYTYIDDIVAGVLAAYERIDRFGYRIWNLGGSDPIRLDAMIGAIAAVVGRPARLDHQPPQPGDVNRTWADLTRSGAELDYAPRTRFADGLAGQWAWMCEQGRSPAQAPNPHP